ncbi:hypothetical protein EDB19DRAFT_2028490 [Suillus lakei]|nr:hypothetical protein EDB19DRAFT_2028490 [Suillus lakei]
MAKTVGIARNMTNLGATYFAIGDSLWRLIEYFASVVIFSNVVGKHDMRPESTITMRNTTDQHYSSNLPANTTQQQGWQARANNRGAMRLAKAARVPSLAILSGSIAEREAHNLGIIEACRENSETIPFAKSSDNIPESTGSLSIEEGGGGGTSCGKDDGGEEEQRENSPNINFFGVLQNSPKQNELASRTMLSGV